MEWQQVDQLSLELYAITKSTGGSHSNTVLQLWTVGKIACLSVASYVNRTYVHMVAARMQCGAITKEKKADGDVAGVGWWPSTEASIESILVTN